MPDSFLISCSCTKISSQRPPLTPWKWSSHYPPSYSCCSSCHYLKPSWVSSHFIVVVCFQRGQEPCHPPHHHLSAVSGMQRMMMKLPRAWRNRWMITAFTSLREQLCWAFLLQSEVPSLLTGLWGEGSCSQVRRLKKGSGPYLWFPKLNAPPPSPAVSLLLFSPFILCFSRLFPVHLLPGLGWVAPWPTLKWLNVSLWTHPPGSRWCQTQNSLFSPRANPASW